jgi:hypothetical protein
MTAQEGQTTWGLLACSSRIAEVGPLCAAAQATPATRSTTLALLRWLRDGHTNSAGSTESTTDLGQGIGLQEWQPDTISDVETPPTPSDIAKDAVPLTNKRQRRSSMSRVDIAAPAPVRGVGDFFALSLDTLVALFRWPFAWREFLEQTWFVARVSLFPSMVLSIPYVVLSVFTFNVLLVEFGASVTGVNEIGPFVTALVAAGSGAAAICADLGARTIREELDALRVMSALDRSGRLATC